MKDVEHVAADCSGWTLMIVWAVNQKMNKRFRVPILISILPDVLVPIYHCHSLPPRFDHFCFSDTVWFFFCFWREELAHFLFNSQWKPRQKHWMALTIPHPVNDSARIINNRMKIILLPRSCNNTLPLYLWYRLHHAMKNYRAREKKSMAINSKKKDIGMRHYVVHNYRPNNNITSHNYQVI